MRGIALPGQDISGAISGPDARPRSAALEFGAAALHDLRDLVAREAAAAGMAADRILDFVLAASEIGTNSVTHGGGRGSARLWREEGALVLEVRDSGHFSGLPVRPTRPDPAQEGGRGLWIANQLCDAMRINSGAKGTSVRLRMAL
jgi:anti-sigma regulatory factor (Ser/Thr protein kinase)